MSLADSLERLSRDLEAHDGSVVLSAAWDILRMGEEAAGAVIDHPEYDELVAAGAVYACLKARNALPLPGGQASDPFPDRFDAADIEAVASMLDRASESLRQLAEFPGQRADDSAALIEIAEFAVGGGQALRAASER